MQSRSDPIDIALSVNGANHVVNARPSAPLIYILRNDLKLNGPKFGCGLGECGACSVLIEGRAARSCVIAVGAVGPRAVITLEGLGSSGNSGPVQAAFIAEQAAQCGYCINGMVMTVHAALTANPGMDQAGMARALRYNLCRCGTHVEIMRAAMRAAAAMREGNNAT